MATVDQLTVLVEAVNRASAELRTVARDIGKVDEAANRVTKANGFSKFTRDFVKDAKSIALGIVGAQAALAAFKGGLTGTIGAAIDFESSFAGIRKTVDATESEFAALEKANRGLALSLPVSVNEINRIGEAAGALGITGVRNIENFERTIATLAITTDLTADTAATAFGHIRAAMGIPVDDLDNLASAIVELGNTGASTESEIVGFLERIAGAGKLLGLTPAELAGISSAFASLGIEAEAGGTAIQKVFLNLQQAAVKGGDELAIFSRVAGKSIEDFTALIRDDPAEAFIQFVEGLKRAGDQAIPVLEALGLEDQRLIRSFLTAAGAGEELRRQIDAGTGAFEANTAATDELNKRIDTTASQIQLLKNNIADVGISIGNELLPAITLITKGLNELIDVVRENELAQLGIKLNLLTNPLTSVATAVVLLSRTWENAWNKMADVAEPVINALLRIGTPIVNVVGAVGIGIARMVVSVTGALGGLVGGWSNAWGKVVSVLDAAAGVIESILQGIVNAVGAVAGAIDDVINGVNNLGGSRLGRLAGTLIPDVPSLGFETPTISIPRAGGGSEAAASLAEVGFVLGSFENDVRGVGDAAEGADPGLAAFLKGLEDTGGAAGGAANNIGTVTDALADGLIDFGEAAALGLSPAQAAALELQRAADIAKFAAAASQFEFQKLAEVLGQQGVTGEAFQLQLALKAIQDELEASGRSVTEFMRDITRDAVNALKDGFSGLFSEPTREGADLDLRIAELELERARERSAGASEEELEAIDEHIDSLREQRDVLDRNADVLKARAKVADQGLITEGELNIAAALHIIAIEEQTGTLKGLSQQAALEGIARQFLIDSMITAGNVYQQSAGISASDSNLDFFNSLPPDQRDALARLLEGLAATGQLARGTSNWRGGPAIVGEKGPELIELPRGARVYSNRETERMLSGTTASGGTASPGTVNVYGNIILPNVREPDDFARELDRSFR